MKKRFLNYSINIISKNENYSKDKLEEIKYGLEALYLTISKMIILFALSYILNITKEFIYLLIFYNLIRLNSFGIHASKSIYCLISSIILFIGGTLICKYINIPIEIMVTISIICIICLYKYAPADTEKRPLLNPKKRKRFKILSVLMGIIYLILIIKFYNYNITNYIFLGLIESVIMIIPITYKIFKLPYNNYKNYNYGV